MLFNPIGELYNLYNRLLERDMVPPFGYVDAPGTRRFCAV